MDRRKFVVISGAGLAGLAGGAWASPPRIAMFDLYSRARPDEFSDAALALAGTVVEIGGFMAPPLKVDADFFVLSDTPVDICPFCSSESEWVETIVYVEMRHAVPLESSSRMIRTRGILDLGTATDPESGFVSRVRLLDASFQRI